MKCFIKSAINCTGLFRQFLPFVQPGVAILRYHSVVDSPNHYANSIGTGIIHSTDIFKQQMELIALKYNPVSLDDVLLFLRDGKLLPRSAVAVTFDDGFVDNHDVAMPILDHCGVPATFYVTVSSLESPVPPWYISLRHAFFTSHQKVWTSEEDGIVFPLSDDQTRNNALVKACQQCAKLAGAMQNTVVGGIEKNLCVPQFFPDPGLMLTWAQVKNIRSRGHIIGSHTLTHPNMAYITDSNVLFEEMSSSKKQIEYHLNEPVIHFSYPSPMLEPHWSERTIEACRNAGYETAVTCSSGKVRSGDDTLALKRVWVPFTMQEFKWYLDSTLLGRTL
jgi:peptidoglycan/xylan/chitin deacetylase (PgdA/CDA1 family)